MGGIDQNVYASTNGSNGINRSNKTIKYTWSEALFDCRKLLQNEEDYRRSILITVARAMNQELFFDENIKFIKKKFTYQNQDAQNCQIKWDFLLALSLKPIFLE